MDLDLNRVGLAEATVGLAYKCKLLIAMLHWGVGMRAARACGFNRTIYLVVSACMPFG